MFVEGIFRSVGYLQNKALVVKFKLGTRTDLSALRADRPFFFI